MIKPVRMNSQINFQKKDETVWFKWGNKPVKSWRNFADAFEKAAAKGDEEIAKFVEIAKKANLEQGGTEESLKSNVGYIAGYKTLSENTEKKLLTAFNAEHPFLDMLGQALKRLVGKK